MWKRLRAGRKNEPEKASSPPPSPTKAGPQGTGGRGTDVDDHGSGTGAEGFLCPMCMKGFQNPEDLQRHFELTHDDTPQPPDNGPPKEDTAGFICPQCKAGYSSPEALQEHFVKIHEVDSSEISANRDGDVLALRQEIDDLRTTLKEEKWYSTELRKEMDKLQGSGAPGGPAESPGLTDEEKVELDLHRQQLKASEESRVLLSSEVVHLRDQLDDAKIENERLQEAKTMIEQKAAKLSGEIVAAKARADEIEGQRVGFENHIKTLTEQLAERNRYTQSLESQLAQRPGADDVLVLRQELVHAQTLMDQITQDQEKETKRVEESHAALVAEHQRATDRIKELENQIETMPNIEDLQKLKSSLDTSASESGELLKKIAEKEASIKEKDKQCMELKESLQEKIALLQSKEVLIQEIQKNLAEKEKAISEKKEELKKVDAELLALKEASARFEERCKLIDGQSHERSEMIEKMQLEKSNVETANRTLETEKLRIEKDLEAAKLLISQKEAELKESGGNRAELQRQIEKLENKITEKERDFEALQIKLNEARQAAQATDYEKEQQITNIKLELERIESKLRERESSLKDLERQLTEVNDKYQTEIVRSEEARTVLREKDAALEDRHRQVEYRDTKVKELEVQVSSMRESVTRLETERTDLLAKIEAGDGVATAINQLTVEKTSLQERLSAAENMNQKQTLEHQEKIDNLHKQIQDLKAQVQGVQEARSKLEENLKAVQEKLEESKVRITTMEGDIKTKGEVLLATETAKESQRADLENHIKTIQNSLDEKMNEIDKTKSHMEQIKQELAEQKDKCSKLEGTIKEQTVQTNQLQQQIVSLEADVKERDAGLERAETARAALQTDLESQLTSAQGQLKDARVNIEKTSTELRESQTDNKKIKNELSEKEEDLKNTREARNKLEVELNKKLEELKMIEQSKRSTEAQLIVAQDTINEKAYQLEKTQSALESEVAKLKDQYSKACEDATAIQKQLKQQIESLESSRNQVLEEKSEAEQRLEETRGLLTSSNKELEDTLAKLKQEESNKADDARVHTGKIRDMDEKINQLQQQLGTEKSTVESQNKSIKDLQGKIAGLEGQKENVEKKLQETEGTLAAKETSIKENQEMLSKYKEDGSAKEATLKKQLEDAGKKEQDLINQLKVATEKSSKLDEQLKALQVSLAELESTHASVTADFQAKFETLQEKDVASQKSISSLQEEKTSLANKVVETEKSLQEVKANRDELKLNKGTLEQTLIDQQKLYQDLLEAKSSLEKELNLTKSNAEEQLQEKKKEIAEQKEARDILIGQKLELQAQVTNLGCTLASLRTEYDESRESATVLQEQLRSENATFSAKAAELEEEKKKLLNEKEEKDVTHEMQISALSENLTVLRTDLATAQTRLAETEKSCNDMRGEKLALEAKLGNNNDERRALLERCLSSEAEVQKLQEKVTEVRRKLDNTQAALHELGRENQSLQIISNKAQGRKWADDSQVNNCMSCDKQFSMTIRKHHCRNCGNIYCNDCSAKSATVAASKKPVRVCDGCYTELQSR